jgi:inhibitor of cysteine peptidase
MRLPAVLLGLALSGCATTTLAPDLFDADDGRTIETERGKTYMVRLGSNPSTGYRWQVIATPNPNVVRMTEQEYVPPAKSEHGGVGGAGMQVWRLDMVGSGGTMLKMAYAREWEKGPAEKTWDVSFRVY